MVKEPWKHCSSKKKGGSPGGWISRMPSRSLFPRNSTPFGASDAIIGNFWFHVAPLLTHTHKINAVQHRTLNSFLARLAGPATREGPPCTCVEQTRSMSCSWSLLLFAGPCNLSPHSAVCFAQKFAATIVLRCCSKETQSQSHTCDWNSFLRMFSRGGSTEKSQDLWHIDFCEWPPEMSQQFNVAYHISQPHHSTAASYINYFPINLKLITFQFGHF